MQMVQEHGEFMCFHSVKTFWMYFTLKSKFLAKIHDILYRSAKLIYIKLLMCAVIDNSKNKQTGGEAIVVVVVELTRRVRDIWVGEEILDVAR